MHQAAREYVSRYATDAVIDVIEIGSRDINGRVRDLFPNANWLGLDLQAGKGVDIVCDAATYQPEVGVDMVVCCEVLEHTADWRKIIDNCLSWIAPGGRLIVTCAGTGRQPHSAHDGGPLQPGEHYENITPAELCEAMQRCGVWIDSAESCGSDTRASGIISEWRPINESNRPS